MKVKQYIIALLILSMSAHIFAEPEAENKKTVGQKIKSALTPAMHKIKKHCTPTNILLAAVGSAVIIRALLHIRDAHKPKYIYLNGQRVMKAQPVAPTPDRVNHAAPAGQDCNICYDEKRSHELAVLQCGHVFCRDCLLRTVNTGLEDGSTQTLRCPNPRCRADDGRVHKFNEHDIRSITNDRQIINNFLRTLGEEWLATHAKHCRTADCDFVFLNERNIVQAVECPECKHEYCSNCCFQHDNNITCQQAIDRQNDAWVRQHTRACPNCHAHIEKNEGCNHMTCRTRTENGRVAGCGYEFCWLCSGRWSGNHVCPPRY